MMEAAVTLAFLTLGFKYLDKEEQLIDGLEEDDFVYDCYPLAKAIEELHVTVAENKICPGVYHYEAIEDIAAQTLFDCVKAHGQTPTSEQFMKLFEPKLREWYEKSDHA